MYRNGIILAAGAMLASASIAQTAPAPTPSPAPAPAPAGATVAAGATIYDPQGGVVGTVASTDGVNAIVDTGSVKAAVPLGSFGAGPSGPLLALTKAQLEAAAAQQRSSPEFRARLIAGTTVYGSAGTPVGTIKAADAQFVTLTTTKGDVRLPIAGFGPGPKGVTIGLTAGQLADAISSATKR